MTSKRLIELIEAVGKKPRSYSGRGMYGQTCIGIELEDISHAFTIGAAMAAEASVDEREDLAWLHVEWDSMGLDAILYFPRFGWPEFMDKSEEG